MSIESQVLKTPSAERDLLEDADFIYRKRREMSTNTEEFIQRKVASGQFQSRDEVIEAALDVYQDIDVTDDMRDEIQRRLKDADAGGVVLFDFEDLRQKLRAERAQRRASRQ